MNIFNRVFIVVLLLGLMAVLILGVVLPQDSIATLRYVLDGADALLAPPGVYVYWAATATLLLLAVLLLALELYRPQRLAVTVRQAGGGVVELSTDSVRRSLEYHLGQVPGVTGVRPTVISHGNSVQVALELETDPLMDVPAKSEEVIQLARELIEGKLGLKVGPGGLRVSVRQAPYTEGGAVPPAVPPADLPGDLSLDGPAAS